MNRDERLPVSFDAPDYELREWLAHIAEQAVRRSGRDFSEEEFQALLAIKGQKVFGAPHHGHPQIPESEPARARYTLRLAERRALLRGLYALSDPSTKKPPKSRGITPVTGPRKRRLPEDKKNAWAGVRALLDAGNCSLDFLRVLARLIGANLLHDRGVPVLQLDRADTKRSVRLYLGALKEAFPADQLNGRTLSPANYKGRAYKLVAFDLSEDWEPGSAEFEQAYAYNLDRVRNACETKGGTKPSDAPGIERDIWSSHIE
ncbi:hypothetical protein NKI09_07125 [Mesorhizobium sp. M0757]|uniref:hypothetical protein n=1 Tax=Mesorhizobium sp. M0757 TaxID=2956993 RepID=UPI00333A0ABF